jgi:hypothetical protein
MLIITRESVEELSKRLLDPAEIEGCRDEVRRMLEIKEVLLWRADYGTCCGGGSGLSLMLAGEVRALEEALDALEQGDITRAAATLGDYSCRLD